MRYSAQDNFFRRKAETPITEPATLLGKSRDVYFSATPTAPLSAGVPGAAVFGGK